MFALLYQTKPLEAGQKALVRCFQGRPNKVPQSALPVVVDSKGQANLPGRYGFDQALAFDLLNGIYSTNLAAQDTLAAAKLIHSSAMRSYRTSKERLFLAESDLDSLSTRLKTVESSKEAEAIKKEMDWRNNRIAYELNEQKKQLKAVSLAQQAVANATAVAGQSFECGSKLFQLANAGINRLENFIASSDSGGGLKSGYLLSKRYVFIPLTESLNENEILVEAAKAFQSTTDDTSQSAPAKQAPITLSAKISPWLAARTIVFGPVRKMIDTPETQFFVEGRSLAELKAASPPVLKAERATIVFTPALLASGAENSPLYFRDYPFKGLPVPESQLIYYCQNGYRQIGANAGDDRTSDQTVMETKISAGGGSSGASASGGSPSGGSSSGGSASGASASSARGSSKVAWSILARDLVANRGVTSTHQRLGLPLTPAMTGWCKRALNKSSQTKDSAAEAAETCPGLAAEWQLRSPVMLLNESEGGLLKGTTLSDPASGQRVPQIPPVGPDLM